MELSDSTSKTLDGWVGPETWHTTHPLDTARFYRFVDVYAKQHGHTFDEAELREEIVRRLGKKGNINDRFIALIQKRIRLAYNILDFLEQTNR